MKRLFLIFTFFVLFTICLFTIPVHAVTPSAVPDQTSQDVNQQINELKERVASRVASLKLVDRRGVIGTVTDITDTQITLSDLQGNVRFVDVDELTRFSSPSAVGSFGISDITKGTKLGVLGLYNKQSRRLLARFVNVKTLPKFLYGAVAAIDNENFIITVVCEDGKQTLVEVETITKTLLYTKDSGLMRSGFSKIKENDHAIIVGFPDIKDKNRIIASRILLFPDIPKNPKIIIPEESTPSTGSGKKLTPITR